MEEQDKIACEDNKEEMRLQKIRRKRRDGEDDKERKEKHKLKGEK
jgi:hypothetical protein